MTAISPEAQALIDRLARMDPTNPRDDKSMIERAMTTHLAELGLPGRPFVWVEDAQTGCWIVESITANDVDDWDHSRDASMDVTRDAARQADSNAVWMAARTVARGAAYRAARVLAWGAARIASSATAWHGVGTQAANAVTDINGFAAFNHPATAKLVNVTLPLLDAFEAGLFVYWITPRDVICVPQPALGLLNGRLHRADGPAVAWPSGEAYHFWRGVQMPAWIIEEPHKISIEEIRNESNQEIRRCMVEVCGLSRCLKDAGARLIHEDEYGKLWSMQVGDQEWRVVEVVNGTPEPDGTHRIYTLNVTGAERVLGWPIETARAAVASTFGMRPEEYRPTVRT